MKKNYFLKLRFATLLILLIMLPYYGCKKNVPQIEQHHSTEELVNQLWTSENASEITYSISNIFEKVGLSIVDDVCCESVFNVKRDNIERLTNYQINFINNGYHLDIGTIFTRLKKLFPEKITIDSIQFINNLQSQANIAYQKPEMPENVLMVIIMNESEYISNEAPIINLNTELLPIQAFLLNTWIYQNYLHSSILKSSLTDYQDCVDDCADDVYWCVLTAEFWFDLGMVAILAGTGLTGIGIAFFPASWPAAATWLAGLGASAIVIDQIKGKWDAYKDDIDECEQTAEDCLNACHDQGGGK